MTASLTLNKITAQRGISIGEAANRVSDLGWTPSYVQEAMTFPTDYKISKVPRDPMKQVLRSYFPMQEEKDNRVYGALDAALRGDMFRNVEPRWIEWMKLFLAIIPFPEISAARSMAMVGRLSPGEELRTGFTMQMVDELRHSTIQMNLKKWYMENHRREHLSDSCRRNCLHQHALRRDAVGGRPQRRLRAADRVLVGPVG
jgi:propane monooxygenase large subunit